MKRAWIMWLAYLGTILVPLDAGAAPGSLDTSFGLTGRVITAIGTGHAVAIDGSGRIVVAGTASGTNYDVAVVRYNANGSLDTTFGSGGKVTTPIGAGDDRG